MLAAAVALGLAVLSKGIAALVLIGGTVLIHMGLARDVRPLKRWHLMVTLPAFLAVTVPWFLVVSRRNPEFASFFFLHEHFARYLTDVSQRVQPWWYFLPFVSLALLPWLVPMWHARSDLRWQRPASDREVIQSFLLIWCAFVVFFFSVSQSKLVTYIFPIMPPLSVLIAPAVVKRASAISFASWITFAIVAVGATGLFVVANRNVGHIPQAVLVWAVVAMSLGIAAARRCPIEPGCCCRGRGARVSGADPVVQRFAAPSNLERTRGGGTAAHRAEHAALHRGSIPAIHPAVPRQNAARRGISRRARVRPRAGGPRFHSDPLGLHGGVADREGLDRFPGSCGLRGPALSRCSDAHACRRQPHDRGVTRMSAAPPDFLAVHATR